jgi:hypothetical protein
MGKFNEVIVMKQLTVILYVKLHWVIEGDL